MNPITFRQIAQYISNTTFDRSPGWADTVSEGVHADDANIFFHKANVAILEGNHSGLLELNISSEFHRTRLVFYSNSKGLMSATFQNHEKSESLRVDDSDRALPDNSESPEWINGPIEDANSRFAYLASLSVLSKLIHRK